MDFEVKINKFNQMCGTKERTFNNNNNNNNNYYYYY